MTEGEGEVRHGSGNIRSALKRGDQGHEKGTHPHAAGRIALILPFALALRACQHIRTSTVQKHNGAQLAAQFIAGRWQARHHH